MRMRFPVYLCVVVGLLTAAPVFAQEDDANCKDHPMFSRMPSYVIQDCEEQEFSAVEFDLGGDKVQKIEGHYWRFTFVKREAAKTAGPLQIGRNYWNVMAKQGGTRFVENLDPGGGDFVGNMPGPKGGGRVWVRVEVSNSGEMYGLTVVQEEAMRQDIELSASEMAAEIAKTGSITLRNILFDTAKATLKPESEAVLRTVVEMLKADAALKIEVQGHTDNVGAKDANVKLSKDRADSVKAFLVKGGIADARLTTAGFGDTQPVAPNNTEDGRAQNRRVVLARK